ncbi:DEAD/DEAH box helicase [Pacificimonas flava]|uniref:DEAD-box ATP-dependent RNA helicase RhpA n=2 Tax=Pacificimonas TaxID=1960290 RepID=A0A219B1T9_9SPHN|nr:MULTISPECIES: DEAD/DEAH box helicase [Pacificimonas]MBZ6378057.1 DEAD/DEAH box helicase [Pacificimonas aurantium]OWV32301.1 DEAD/DEAH box helicase [Pacificimonas flava]
MTKFSDFGFAEPIAKAIAAEGYDSPTPIQAQAIPYALEGRDLLGIAQTGTGKTAAFALPILQAIATRPYKLTPKAPRVLVLAPTRELAAQIGESFKAYGRGLRLTVETIFGGVKDGPQKRRLHAGVDILIATPGRLLDLIDQNACRLDKVEFLVLDEADQMLDLGFIHALRRIVPMVPKDRQTLFFSATMPKQIKELVGKYLSEPAKVEVQPESTTAERVEQRCHFIDAKQKQPLLTLTLERADYDRVLVFTRTKHGADRVVRNLEAANIRSAAIHGNKSQAQRTRALDAFRAGDVRVLVATDIAARGIDVSGVSHVINFDIPEVAEQYVHRIGRTARAGAAGEALSFVAPAEKQDWKAIERTTRQKIETLPLPENFMAEVERINGLKLPPRGAAGAERGDDRRGGGGNRRSRGGANGGGQRRRKPEFSAEREDGARKPRPKQHRRGGGAQTGAHQDGPRQDGQRQDRSRDGAHAEGGKGQQHRAKGPGGKPGAGRRPHRKGGGGQHGQGHGQGRPGAQGRHRQGNRNRSGGEQSSRQG